MRVKKRGDETKYLAKVLAVGTECDVALLTVEDDAFWEGVQPIRLGPMPMLQESVAVVGYPVGGDTTSVTAGVVSRIEVRPPPSLPCRAVSLPTCHPCRCGYDTWI